MFPYYSLSVQSGRHCVCKGPDFIMVSYSMLRFNPLPPIVAFLQHFHGSPIVAFLQHLCLMCLITLLVAARTFSLIIQMNEGIY